ncbi:MAG: META domain-containing protein [Steroidobacteraceae bacterium]
MTQPTAESVPSFVNTVWQVTESKQVAPGSIRVFLADGTLVMSSPNATPAFGIWRYTDGRLTIIEEGQQYSTDILELGKGVLRIRMHSPGEPVEMRLEPAEPPRMDAIAQASKAVVARQAESEPALIALWGTAWRLESLAGAAVQGGSQPTLEFASDGRASGNGSCNRFHGVVTVEGDRIQFGGIAATRMACAEAARMQQEEVYFAALQAAERFEMDAETLRIYATDRPEPLRFVATQATAQAAGNSIQRAPAAAAMPSPTGIWTVVGHHLPGASARGADEVSMRYGETLRLSARAAIVPGARCESPGYMARRVPTNQFLADEFKLAPDSLPPLAARSQIQVMDVTCSGAPWTAFGARLIEIDRDRALAPWDGVFFALRRDRDFRALGQEPGWQLEMRMGSEMRLTYDYGKGTAVTPAARVQVDSSNGTRTYHAVSGGNDLRVVIVPVACADSMSGRPFAATVSVTLNGRTFRGCGEELATPFQG